MFPRAITEACMKRPAFVIGDRVIVKPGTENNPSLRFRLMSILRRGILTRTERETGLSHLLIRRIISIICLIKVFLHTIVKQSVHCLSDDRDLQRKSSKLSAEKNKGNFVKDYNKHYSSAFY